MTMLVMYVSRQTVSESAIEGDGTKNKMWSLVRKLENLILQTIFFQPNYVELVYKATRRK